MLHGLGSSNQGRIKNCFVLNCHVAGDLFGFLDNAIDSWAIHRLPIGVTDVEHLLNPAYVILRLGQMMFESRPQLRVCTYSIIVGSACKIFCSA
jgi:hypothetical protein